MSDNFIFTIWSTTTDVVFVDYSWLVRNVLTLMFDDLGLAIAVPKPATLDLLGIGLAGPGLLHRK
jgi:hypothetical protein